MNDCPTLRQFERTLDASHSLYAQLRRLRIMTDRCRTCKHEHNCPARQELWRKIELALTQVNREFGIDGWFPNHLGRLQ